MTNELIEVQAFEVMGKKGNTIILRNAAVRYGDADRDIPEPDLIDEVHLPVRDLLRCLTLARKDSKEQVVPHPFLGEEKTWQDVVVECEGILDCEETAESPWMSNLPNLIRDLRVVVAHLTSKECAEECAGQLHLYVGPTVAKAAVDHAWGVLKRRGGVE